jgi:RNA polymerase sigma-70 factor (ECF subfamily)
VNEEGRALGYDAPSMLVIAALQRRPAPHGRGRAPRKDPACEGGGVFPDGADSAASAGADEYRRDARPHALFAMQAPADNASDPAEAVAAAALAERIRAGDAQAEGELVGRYSRGLSYLLRRTTGDPSLADDLHQETFRIVIQRLRGTGLEQPERLAGFIRRTARNLFLADYRRNARRRTGELDDSTALHDPAPSPLGRVLEAERVQLVRRLVGELRTDRDRQVLYRYYLAEEDKERICRDLGLSDIHFNRVLFRARQRFRELLERAAAEAPAAREAAK